MRPLRRHPWTVERDLLASGRGIPEEPSRLLGELQLHRPHRTNSEVAFLAASSYFKEQNVVCILFCCQSRTSTMTPSPVSIRSACGLHVMSRLQQGITMLIAVQTVAVGGALGRLR